MRIEHKFLKIANVIGSEAEKLVEGYASLFRVVDQGGDLVEPGAYAASLARLKAEARSVRMLWQHDPREPIGVWDLIQEDARGLKARGRILSGVARGREAAALVAAGALDGLSIGYRVVRSEARRGGGRRLIELDLWEISLVTFPMLPNARLVDGALAAKSALGARAWAGVLEQAAAVLRGAEQAK